MKINPAEGIPVKAKGIPAIALVTEYIPGKAWRDYNFPAQGRVTVSRQSQRTLTGSFMTAKATAPRG